MNIKCTWKLNPDSETYMKLCGFSPYNFIHPLRYVELNSNSLGLKAGLGDLARRNIHFIVKTHIIHSIQRALY